MSDFPPLILAIDPGASGGVVFRDVSRQVVLAFKMPEDEYGLVELLEEHAASVVLAVCEELGPMPTNEKKGIGGGAIPNFRLGLSYGTIRGILAAMKFRRLFVRAQKWQSELQIPPRKKKKRTEHKNVLKERAQQLFPGVKVTLAVADALLMSEWGVKKL